MRPHSIRLIRRPLLGDLLYHSHCRQRLSLACQPCLLRGSIPTRPKIQSYQTRNLWSMGKPDPLPDPRFLPGAKTIHQLLFHLDDQIGRPPSDKELFRAFRQIVAAYTGRTALDRDAVVIRRCYEYIRNLHSFPQEITVGVMKDTMHCVLHGISEKQADLSRTVFRDLVQIEGIEIDKWDLYRIVSVLSNSGNTQEAVDILERYGSHLEGGLKREWAKVLEGFAMEGNEKALLETWDSFQRRNVALVADLYYQVIAFYSRRNDTETTKLWYGRILDEGVRPSPAICNEVLKLCMRNKLSWGEDIYRSLLDWAENDGTFTIRRSIWNVILQWSASMKGIEEVEKLMQHMKKLSDVPNSTASEPTIETFNCLLEFALKREDCPLAGELVPLREKWKFIPNLKTLALQMEYHIMAQDIENALAVYERLKMEDIPEGEEPPQVPKLLRAMCTYEATEMKTIQSVYADLVDWKVSLDAETLCSLVRFFLEKNAFKEAAGALSREVLYYSDADRRKMILEIGEFIGRSTTPIEAAWDAYQILYQHFPELPVRERNDIMRLFFDLGRSDMATVIFQDMRRTRNRRPRNTTYTIAFSGIARARDIENLRIVHNMLRIDINVEPDTTLLNSLMNAYNQCGMPERALSFWDDISRSPEGPDHATISIVMDVSGRIYDGLPTTKRIWGRLRGLGVPLTKANWTSYIEALGRNGGWKDGMKALKTLEANEGITPDAKILAALARTMDPSDTPKELELWAKETYPDEWTEAEKLLAEQPVEPDLPAFLLALQNRDLNF